VFTAYDPTNANTLDFSGAWSSFWSAITGTANIKGVLTLAGVVGLLLVVGAIVTWLFQKRRGGGLAQGTSGLIITIVVGAILAGPNFAIPAILKVVDTLGNAVIKILGLGAG